MNDAYEFSFNEIADILEQVFVWKCLENYKYQTLEDFIEEG